MTRLTIVLIALAAAGCGAASTDDEAATVFTTSAPSLAPTAIVTCSPSGASVTTPEVAARRDGVHVEIRNETGGQQVVHVEAADSAQGEGFPPGAHERVWALPPGPTRIACSSPAEEPGEKASFEVFDPAGVWSPTALDCDGEVSSAIFDYVADAAGVQGEPAEIARHAADLDVAPGDEAQLAGYPEGGDGTAVRLLRDGRAYALVELMPANGGWLVMIVTRCADA